MENDGIISHRVLVPEAIDNLGWWTLFHRHVLHASAFIVKGVLCAVRIIGAIGGSFQGISSLLSVGPAAYFTIAQNPILSSKVPLRDAVFHSSRQRRDLLLQNPSEERE